LQTAELQAARSSGRPPHDGGLGRPPAGRSPRACLPCVHSPTPAGGRRARQATYSVASQGSPPAGGAWARGFGPRPVLQPDHCRVQLS